MTPRELQAEIMSGPKAAECAPYVNDGSDPSRKATAYADDQAIATILSAGRVKIGSREVGDGAVANALGYPDGPVFLYYLAQAASAPADQTPQSIAACAMAAQAWRSLSKASLDVGNLSVRAAIDMMVGTLLTAEQADAVKAMAEQPDSVSAADVSRAMRGPWGDE